MKTSCTIIIYHFESIPFLRACVRKIRQYKHPEIDQHIIITEQSSDSTRNLVVSEFGDNTDITIIPMKPLWSGYAIDYVMRYGNIQTDFVCGIEPDVFPIHKNWLYVSIKLLQEFDFKFVGGLLTETNPEKDAQYYCYTEKKIPFYWISQYLRVGRTSDYLELSLQGGFTRFHNRPEAENNMTWANNDWAEWAKTDYIHRGSDDGTIAHFWEDNYKENDKFSYAVTRIMGVPPESGYGRVIDDMVFHFGFCRTSCGVENEMGKNYCRWKNIINIWGCDDALIEDMINASIPVNIDPFSTRSVWNGKLKKSFPPSEALNKKIDALKRF